MQKAKIIIPLAAITIISLGGLWGIKQVRADTVENNSPPIVQKIAERFGLNQDEVQQVFDEEHQYKMQQRKQRFEDRLTIAVADGVITAEQKQALLQKMAELRPDAAEMKELSFAERRQLHKQHREEMKAWVEANGIDLKALFPLRGIGEMRGDFD